jgi:hypothetical protein
MFEASRIKASNAKAGVLEDANALEAISKEEDFAIVLQRRNTEVGLAHSHEITEAVAANECLMTHSFSLRPSRGTAASDRQEGPAAPLRRAQEPCIRALR